MSPVELSEARVSGGAEPLKEADGDLSNRTFWALLALLMLAAAALRFYHLGDKTLWIDEGGSWVLTQLTWPEFVHAIRTCMAEMGLYYFLLRLWTVFGTSEFALRSFSALISVATVPLVGMVGRSLYSRKAGILAAAVFSFHVWNINFAREARTYPLLTLLIVIGWLLIARIVEEPEPLSRWVWLGVVSVLAVHAQFLAVLNLAAQFATLLFFPMTWKFFKRALNTGLWIIVACLPAAFYATRATGGNVSWAKPTTFSMAVSLHSPDYRVESASGNVVYLLDFLSGWWGSRIAICGLGAIIALLIGILLFRCLRDGRSRTTWAAAVPVLGILVPVFGLIAISAEHPAFVPRYLIPVVVPLALGVGLLGQRLRTGAWAASLIVVSAFLLKPWPGYLKTTPYQDFRGAANYVAEHAKPGDVLYIWEPFARPALAYYGERFANFPKFLYPKPDDQFRPERLGPDPWTVPAEMNQHDRVWVVFNFEMPAKTAGTWPYFYQATAEHTGHRLKSSFFSQNMQVLEFVRQPGENSLRTVSHLGDIPKVRARSAPVVQLP